METYQIDSSLAKRIQQELGQNVFLCYQCVKCTSGCPLVDYFDWQPNQIMRAAQLGQEDIALQSDTIWLCAACQTCTTRCPQGLDIAAIMDMLTRQAAAAGLEPSIPEVNIFNQAFMREVRLWGRAYELGLLAEMKLRTGNFTQDLDLGAKMFAKNKLSLFPETGRPKHKVDALKGVEEAVAYYPGCSLHSTAKEFNQSTLAVCEELGLELIEPKGWTCCGSTAAHRCDPAAAVQLPLGNLSLMEQYGFQQVMMPCAACFNRHKVAQYEFDQHPGMRQDLPAHIQHGYQGKIKVNTLLDTLQEMVGMHRVAGHVKRPLEGLKIVPYYGCLVTRPPDVTGAEHPENPTGMDDLLAALGAEVVDWSYKTSCCGASHSLTRPDIVLDLSFNLIEHARESGADMIAVVCPLCHANLDARQTQMPVEPPMPVIYITQLMALAFGLPDEAAALNKNLIDPRPLLKEKLQAVDQSVV